eukprot:jgi/Orpsp1_1/1188885/evm.model.d7180000067948.1
MSALENPILPKDDYIDAIRNSCKELYNEVEKDGSLKINDDNIDKFIETIKNNNFESFGKYYNTNNPLKVPLKFDTLEEELNFVALNALLAFGSGWRNELHEACNRGAANTIKFGIISMHISKMQYGTINHMANLTITDISSIFQIPLLGEEETKENMPGVTVSTQHCLREFAEKLQYVFHKTALDLKKGGYRSLAQFVMYLINSTKNEVNRAEVILKGIINVLTVFQDSAVINGKEIFIFKKAQLFVYTLYKAFHKKYPLFDIKGIEKLTIFADNVIPTILIDLGILKVSSQILKAIEEKENMSKTNMDVKLRAVSIVACEKIVNKLKEQNITYMNNEILETDIDTYIWNLGKEEKYKDDLPVYFPYDYIYPEQYSYMKDLKKSLDAKGHCLLEMPSGTGKTITLLSLIVAYQMHYPEHRKLVYCSRTIPELEKTLQELKRLMEYRESCGLNEQFLGLGLTSRKNLCIHPEIIKEKKGKTIDSKCRNLTASWIREKVNDSIEEIPLCDFYENLENGSENASIPFGVYTLEDLKNFCKEKTYCPYFLARRMIPYSNVVVYSYYYLLDPKVAELISKEIEKDSIVVFDEAHNI